MNFKKLLALSTIAGVFSACVSVSYSTNSILELFSNINKDEPIERNRIQKYFDEDTLQIVELQYFESGNLICYTKQSDSYQMKIFIPEEQKYAERACLLRVENIISKNDLPPGYKDIDLMHFLIGELIQNDFSLIYFLQEDSNTIFKYQNKYWFADLYSYSDYYEIHFYDKNRLKELSRFFNQETKLK